MENQNLCIVLIIFLYSMTSKENSVGFFSALGYQTLRDLFFIVLLGKIWLFIYSLAGIDRDLFVVILPGRWILWDLFVSILSGQRRLRDPFVFILPGQTRLIDLFVYILPGLVDTIRGSMRLILSPDISSFIRHRRFSYIFSLIPSLLLWKL